MDVVDIELHPKEQRVPSRASIVSHGCVFLRYMPSCIYVRVRRCSAAYREAVEFQT